MWRAYFYEKGNLHCMNFRDAEKPLAKARLEALKGKIAAAWVEIDPPIYPLGELTDSQGTVTRVEFNTPILLVKLSRAKRSRNQLFIPCN